MGNNVVVPDRQSFETMEQVRLDATVQTILQQGNVNFKDNVTSIADLPTTGNEVDDFRMVTDNGWVYKRNGSAWIQSGVNAFQRFVNGDLNGNCTAVAILGDYLYIAGSFTFAGPLSVAGLARYNLVTNNWEGLGAKNGDVTLMLAYGDYVYMCGTFTVVDGVTVNRIARYNTLTDTWEAFTGGSGTGCDGNVTTFVVDNNILYVAGTFNNAGGVSAVKIARFNLITNTWSAFGTGVIGSSIVGKMIVDNGFLYIGGTFTSINGVSATNIARYDIALDSWGALGSGTSNAVNAMSIYNNILYLIGPFTVANGLPCFGFASIDLNSLVWSIPSPGAFFAVWSEFYEDVLYFGGSITTAGYIDVNGLASYNTTTGKILAVGKNPGAGQQVIRFTISGIYLYAVGSFSSMDGIHLNRYLARYNIITGVWS